MVQSELIGRSVLNRAGRRAKGGVLASGVALMWAASACSDETKPASTSGTDGGVTSETVANSTGHVSNTEGGGQTPPSGQAPDTDDTSGPVGIGGTPSGGIPGGETSGGGTPGSETSSSGTPGGGTPGETSGGGTPGETSGSGTPGGGTLGGGTPSSGTPSGGTPSGGDTSESGDTSGGKPPNESSTGDATPATGPLPTSSEDTSPVDIPDDNEVRAFPGVTGFGAMASGGRGGQVIKVTTLADSGPGSFREAITASGPRIIVFAVSGVIESDEVFEIYSGDVTIAGQTAPGGGITIKGRLFASYDENVGNIIVRHVRVRPEYDGSEGSQFDAVQFSLNHTIVFDHVSVGFGVDETIDLYNARNITVQWSTIEDPGTEGHEEGEHNYGMINGPYGQYIAVHHNLFAHAKNRNPAIANGPADVINNVMYDVGVGFVHHNPAAGQFRLIGNFFKDGPSADLIPFYFDDESLAGLEYYIADNWVEGGGTECDAGELDNPWQQCENYQDHDESYRSDTDFDFTSEDGYRATPVTSGQQAYQDILDKVGAFPRDIVTRQAIDDLQNGTGSWGMPLPSDLMAGLTPTLPPADEDNDGMADSWETSHGLDPEDGDDHITIMDSGYTAIEEYINELAERLIQ